MIRLPELAASQTASPKKKKSNRKNLIQNFVRRFSSLWSSVRLRLRLLSEEIFPSDDLVDELFEDEETDDTLDRLTRLSRGYNSTEEKFLREYQKYQNLDRMHQQLQQDSRPETIVSSPLLVDETELPEGKSESKRYTVLMSSSTSKSSEPIPDFNTDNETAKTSFQDLDVCELRELWDAYVAQGAPETDDSKVAILKDELPSLESIDTNNIGEKLWELRRSKWLAKDADSDKKLEHRIEEMSISHIPRESYARIYCNLVDKEKPLKGGRRLNLADLIQVINAGWIAEERWERAARGLP